MANYQGIIDWIFASRSIYSTSIHQFCDLTTIQHRYQSFGICLKVKPWVRTPICRNWEIFFYIWLPKYFVSCTGDSSHQVSMFGGSSCSPIPRGHHQCDQQRGQERRMHTSDWTGSKNFGKVKQESQVLAILVTLIVIQRGYKSRTSLDFEWSNPVQLSNGLIF